MRIRKNYMNKNLDLSSKVHIIMNHQETHRYKYICMYCNYFSFVFNLEKALLNVYV